MRLRNGWVIAILAIMSISLALVARESSPSFQKCQTNYENKGNDEKEPKGFSFGIERVVALQCTARFVDSHNAVITALATVLLTFVTGGLVWTGYMQFKTTRIQLRAYVFPDTVSMWDGTTLSPPQSNRKNTPGIVLTWKNTGQTPAGNVISWAQIAIIEPINEATLVVPVLQKTFQNHLGAGVINSKSLWYQRALTKSEITDIIAGVKGIYLYGRIEYSDIFEHERFSNFRLIYTGPYPPVGMAIFNVCQSGNNYE